LCPPQAPSALPVNITIQSPSHQAGNAFLISSQTDLQLYSSASGSTYNWSTANVTLLSQSCWTSAGPYLSVPASCLAIGGRYSFSLRVEYGIGKVRRNGNIFMYDCRPLCASGVGSTKVLNCPMIMSANCYNINR
jgi:hypothetical protein